jgi:hypothetical protein
MSNKNEKRFEITWRAKWTCDGCKTIEEMAQSLEARAADLRELAKDGFWLGEEVADDYAFLKLQTSNPELLNKYKDEPEEMTKED